MWLKPLFYKLLNPWLATFQKLPEKRAVHVESIKRKTFGKLFNIHCRWLQPTGNNQFIIAALAPFLYPQPLEHVDVLFHKKKYGRPQLLGVDANKQPAPAFFIRLKMFDACSHSVSLIHLRRQAVANVTRYVAQFFLLEIDSHG